MVNSSKLHNCYRNLGIDFPIEIDLTSKKDKMRLFNLILPDEQVMQGELQV
jgi:hypothetical protein